MQALTSQTLKENAYRTLGLSGRAVVPLRLTLQQLDQLALALAGAAARQGADQIPVPPHNDAIGQGIVRRRYDEASQHVLTVKARMP